MGGGTTIFEEIKTSRKLLFIAILKFYKMRLKDLKKYYLTIFVFMAWIVLSSHIMAQEERKPLAQEQVSIMQEKLKKAMEGLKREIKIDVKVENGGTIAGNVKCKRARYPENVVVSIEKVGGNIYPAPEEHGIIDQFNLTFVPHVLAVQKGTKIDFLNSDSVQHNVFSPPNCCQPFNVGTYDVGVVKTVAFNEACEIPLLCNVHPEMSAYVVVLDNPYFSVTDKDGAFTIENVPPGTYKLNAWHESLRTVSKEVTVEAGKATTVNFQLKKRK